MRTYFFTEGPNPHLPDESQYDSIRITLPNRHYDPATGADLWHRYLDLYRLSDEVGLDLMVNEHHSTPTCVDPALAVISGALARETKNARILQLGNPAANRRDALRLAEETALVDVLSRGRLDVGFIRGVPYELSPANSNPVGTTERLWEAHDLVKAAWTTHDGPFNFEGDYFHYRQVNIFPRPYQQPHPPIWFVAMSGDTNVKLAEYGYVTASFLLGYNTRPLFDVYRKRWAELGHPNDAPMDRFALMAFVYVADSDAEARRGAEKFSWYTTTGHKISPAFRSPPGYNSVDSTVKMIRQVAAGRSPYGSNDIDSLIERGVLICGTPDTVYEQLVRLYKAVGFGHLLGHFHAGFMGYDETAKSVSLFGREVQPRLAQIELTEELDAVSIGEAATVAR